MTNLEYLQDRNIKRACELSAPLTIICGHYGVGKTNFSLNLALDLCSAGKEVTLIDLDLVNPYFRSSDFMEDGNFKGIRMIAPVFAGSTLDAPSLSGAIEPAIESASENHYVIIDVGGDEVGATSLGRFSAAINKMDYRMLYVVNAYRNLTQDADEAYAVLREIEEKTGLKASGIINNSHLKQETVLDLIRDSMSFSESVSKKSGLDVLATTVPASFVHDDGEGYLPSGEDALSRITSVLSSTLATQALYFVQVYVKTPWE